MNLQYLKHNWREVILDGSPFIGRLYDPCTIVEASNMQCFQNLNEIDYCVRAMRFFRIIITASSENLSSLMVKSTRIFPAGRAI